MADFDWVTDRIAVGGEIKSLADVRTLEAKGITHILNVRTNQDEVPWVQKVGLQYYSNPTKDEDEETKEPGWFRSSVDVIVAALQVKDGRILVHCQEGLNRSASTVYFYLRKVGLKKDLCIKLITDARPKCKDGMIWNDDAEKALKKLGWK